jgi:hypothetical protein
MEFTRTVILETANFDAAEFTSRSDLDLLNSSQTTRRCTRTLRPILRDAKLTVAQAEGRRF